jgi:hypothetical protein
MVNPKIWGKPGWVFLTCIVVEYPDNPTKQIKKKYYSFFNNLQYILPCEFCRINLEEHYKKRPLTKKDLESREKLLKWFIDIQNMVDISTGKKAQSYKTALKKIIKLTNSIPTVSN